MVEMGRELFAHEWKQGEPGIPGGDGLGPVYNAISCAACHTQGGIGGGGAIDKNAEMLSVVAPTRDAPLTGAAFTKTLKEIHPGLVTGDKVNSSVILHRYGVDPRYDAARTNLVGVPTFAMLNEEGKKSLQRAIMAKPVMSFSPTPGVQFRLSQRQTPTLFGAGLIDQIPEELIAEIAALQNSQEGEISGRVAPDGIHVGRFGWRCQIADLYEFVIGACANELGLQVPGKDQALDPFQPHYAPPGYDLNKLQCRAITMYVASLPPPQFVKPTDPEQAALAKRGYQLFQSVGCATCHLENVGPAKGLFSDLLLHDMGAELVDPIPAMPTIRIDKIEWHRTPDGEARLEPKFRPGTKIPVTYGGPTASAIITNLNMEWRTAPLWGLHDTPPYLHDGRAKSVLEAIAFHGGEAHGARGRFFALPAVDRVAVLQFLDCLRSPAVAK